LLEQKRDVANEMSRAVYNLRKAYSTMVRDLESVLGEKGREMQLSGQVETGRSSV